MPFCTECGNPVSEDHRFCAQCGAALRGFERSEAAVQSTAVAAVPEPPVAFTRPTQPPIASPAGRPEGALSRTSSALLADRDPLTVPASTERGIPPPLVMAGVLLAVALSGLGGYWWFRGKGVATDAGAVEATEQLIETPDKESSSDQRARVPEGDSAPRTAVGDPAWSLLTDSTRETTNAIEALGPPDRKTAVIAPGGSLAVAYPGDVYFYNGPGADIDVHGPDVERTRYTIFAREGAAGRWVRFDVNGRGFRNGVAGHDMGHHGMERARQIMITNEGDTDLAIDALTPRYRQAGTHDEHESGNPTHPRARH